MEHAVPQNITSFQFRLVGDMTLKQFGYLAVGMVIAYIAFVTILPSSPVIGVPIIGLSSLLGVAFAFLPLADRPLDHWVMAFFRAIHSPTQASWKSPLNSGKSLGPQDPTFKNRLGLYLSSLGVNTTPPPPLTRIKPESLNQTPKVGTTQLQQMAEYIKQLQTKVADSERQLQEFRSSTTPPQPTVTPPTPAQTPAPAPIINPQVKIVEPPRPTPAQVTLTSSPNVINGIVTDTAGNYLEGAIISIHDKDGLPVRALKTNKLGQFSGATPLADGIYTITFEKDSLEFETLQVELNGSVLTPLNVSARKGGQVSS
ncbi:hypothetical protein A3A14_02980 [Candidatus Daviesbacteria bacterium RIFCSPLOWO2_01_FULL_43_38]|uniref:SD-repeat containing protein B domain-containing protein n=1 Tax=Candidatus Daviesbacteria bacterium RIFCSPHIGHO2_12_FULL_43_11 TaxID=1797780 RepID=A0A1F5K3A2_9BACT|nr:MAG: hypothetical protein A2874_03565 [Candidatus Daviesbacteria bacterium RIFCSPHIGHO2_01_FULL_43_17]OGE35248.1 MAG: hypothetical protein A3E45_03700 [Candidatus Daviesbacteria bacterium RIFCSPHIGHO2_12_FULL_43_11]OGE63593.1 MAG: hypothetical protein A3A14_02980 [Candidatus Daviesbacteria bacterium RIFCSPLOWO2_01_FULL_43_38]OGE69212.1 MAG: hypothetical protein A3J21_01665 [Candidatus Daviesbacteria bacterium RIFCSPLOWO2_02_FULL_43_11]